MDSWFIFDVAKGHAKCKNDTLVLLDEKGLPWKNNDIVDMQLS